MKEENLWVQVLRGGTPNAQVEGLALDGRMDDIFATEMGTMAVSMHAGSNKKKKGIAC